MKYQVKIFRDAGLEAKWTRTRSGSPIIACREPGRKVFYVVDDRMWEAMNSNASGIAETFKNFTALGDFFSIPA